MWLLKEKGIQCGVHYPVPVHLQKAYQSLNYKVGTFPISEQIAREFISLPMFPELTGAQVGMVALCVKEAVLAGVMA
jgi:dTDP-4-amino-4,6-dideoxygalactose transaminase